MRGAQWPSVGHLPKSLPPCPSCTCARTLARAARTHTPTGAHAHKVLNEESADSLRLAVGHIQACASRAPHTSHAPYTSQAPYTSHAPYINHTPHTSRAAPYTGRAPAVHPPHASHTPAMHRPCVSHASAMSSSSFVRTVRGARRRERRFFASRYRPCTSHSTRARRYPRPGAHAWTCAQSCNQARVHACDWRAASHGLGRRHACN